MIADTTAHHRRAPVLSRTGKSGQRLVERPERQPARIPIGCPRPPALSRVTAATGEGNPADQPNGGSPR